VEENKTFNSPMKKALANKLKTAVMGSGDNSLRSTVTKKGVNEAKRNG